MPRPLLPLVLAPLVFGTAITAASPRLAVVISVDQMRADYLERFAPHFVEGGFSRFRAGANFTQCSYRHGVTKTGPGHAVILTGVYADVHGIIGNEWILPAWPNPEEVNCVEDREAALVGLPPRAWRSPGGVLEAKSGRSPRHLLAPTVGDALKARHGPAARLFGVAAKDRAAILLTGARADGAYWIEEDRVITSTYYRPDLPAFIQTFNAEQRPAKVLGATWDRLLAPGPYEEIQGPDDAEGETTKHGLGRTFPRRIAPGTFDYSPWSNDLVADLAKAVLVHENLGQDDGAPDLLAIGFSQTDKIGHAYGPDSHEVMDSYLRLDRTLAELFAFIDAKVGLAHCVFVLTADHGAPATPERRAIAGLPGGRIRAADFAAPVEAALAAKFGPAPGSQPWAIRDGLGFRLNPAALSATRTSRAAAESLVMATLGRLPGVAAVYGRAQLQGTAPLDAVGQAMRLSFHAGRSPDVVAVLQPYFMDRAEPGVDHGQPYDYDQDVPLAWFGAGIPPGRHSERVGVEDLAPTLAAILGIPPQTLPTRGRRLF